MRSCGLLLSFQRRAAQEVDGGELAQEGEVSAAAGAGEGFWLGEVWGGVKFGSEVEADCSIGFDGCRAGKAVVAHSGEAFG